ncbi:hypothetical protein CLOP_g14483, partial [Closterium sp. NIES-67]
MPPVTKCIRPLAVSLLHSHYPPRAHTLNAKFAAITPSLQLHASLLTDS